MTLAPPPRHELVSLARQGGCKTICMRYAAGISSRASTLSPEPSALAPNPKDIAGRSFPWALDFRTQVLFGHCLRKLESPCGRAICRIDPAGLRFADSQLSAPTAERRPACALWSHIWANPAPGPS